MVFLCGLVSSLESFRFDSLPAGAVDGAIVYAAAGVEYCGVYALYLPMYVWYKWYDGIVVVSFGGMELTECGFVL